jgi:hypothetical protein
MLRESTAVSVYSHPLEQRFEAASYIQTHPVPGRARPVRTNR